MVRIPAIFFFTNSPTSPSEGKRLKELTESEHNVTDMERA